MGTGAPVQQNRIIYLRLETRTKRDNHGQSRTQCCRHLSERGAEGRMEQRKREATADRMIIDIHSHVIWGVDDGAETREQTFQMLRAAAEDGIRKIICTPHITPGVYEFPEERFQEHLETAREFIRREGLPLRLTRGAELLYTELTARMLRDGKVPTLEESRCPLIEFSPSDSWHHILNALQNVSRAGFNPVIAHMERYPAIRTVDQVRLLKTACCAYVQVNARTLTRKQPLLRRRYFDRLFQEMLVDFIATDTHSMPGRGTCMREGMSALKLKYGESCAEHIRIQTYGFFGRT